jgi:hypothetical protein
MTKKQSEFFSKEQLEVLQSRELIELKVKTILSRLWDEQTLDPARKNAFDILKRKAETRLQERQEDYATKPQLVYRELVSMIVDDLVKNPPIIIPQDTVRIEHTQFPPPHAEAIDPFNELNPIQRTRTKQPESSITTRDELNRAQHLLAWELEFKIKNVITRLFLDSIGIVSGSEYEARKLEAEIIDPMQINRGIRAVTRVEVEKPYEATVKTYQDKQTELNQLRFFDMKNDQSRIKEIEKLDKLIAKKQNASTSIQINKLHALKSAKETLLGLKTPVELITSLQIGYDQGVLKRTQKSIHNAIKLMKNPGSETALHLLLRVQQHLIELESKPSNKNSEAHSHKVLMLNLLKKHLSGNLEDINDLIDTINQAKKQYPLYCKGHFKSETDKLVRDTLEFLKLEPTQKATPRKS